MVTMGYVWDRTVETVGERLSVVLPIAIVGLFLPATIIASLQGVLTAGDARVQLIVNLVSLAFSVLSLWAQLAIVAAAVDPRRGLGAAARHGVARLLPAIGIVLLLMLAMAVASIPVFGLLASGGIDAAAVQKGQIAIANLNPGMVVAAILYGFAVLLVLLFVGARLAPLLSVVSEERRGVGAIARAFRLTRRLTWRLAGVVVLYVVIVTVATMAVRTVFGTVLRLFDGGSGPITLTSVVTAIATSAVSAAFSVLATIFCARLYVVLAEATDRAVTQSAAPAVPVHDAPARAGLAHDGPAS
ncbi:hypothetical protein ACFSC3_01540 [Sphingomonas floccifaciens]|uniref:Glycerophosphoryl diester phosphodiesterase membrane domain-containing protein n=1 Tax=Sphingomonas floccifaciens TaxID=1844115 RepID=A0ABW4N874_9SPHN